MLHSVAVLLLEQGIQSRVQRLPGGVEVDSTPPRRRATAAPMAVAVSAKPITSGRAGIPVRQPDAPRAYIISSAAAGLTGMCFACRGFTSR